MKVKKVAWRDCTEAGWKKKSVFFIFCSFLFAFFFLLNSLRGASAPRVQAVQIHKRSTAMIRSNTPRQHASGNNTQVNSQNLQNPDNRSIHVVSVGSHQGNSGNQGENEGFNQDSSGNQGNAISSQHKNIALQENNQLLQNTNSNGETNISNTNIGSDQGNSGNQGFNAGFNQDNASNTGNQVNNQGTTIGTQINNQGSEVNNNGSTILHQVNYLSLVPNIQFHLDLTARPDLSLKVH